MLTLVTSTFEILAEPQRRRILDLLREGERPVGALVERLTLSQPAVSKHLRVLKNAGLVEVRQDAQRRWYRLRPEPLAEIDAWLAPYRRLWATRLDALERHLDAMPAPAADGDRQTRTIDRLHRGTEGSRRR
jgi:DNA-binding transcriptional ArsR family regulator